MILKKIAFIFLTITLFLFGEGKHIIFVLDGSGSMYGVPLQQAKDSMRKTAKAIFDNGDKISLIVPVDEKAVCSEELRVHTEYLSKMSELEEVLSSIHATGGWDRIPLGFEYAQKEMSTKGYIGHIYMFGDCDGLNVCDTGIEAIAKKYKELKKLTPFTYMQLNGCDGYEIKSWNEAFAKIGQKTGSASIFNYESIRDVKIKKIKRSKSYFTNPKFINSDATSNNGRSYRNRPWRCVDSDKLFWLVITKEEQKLDFYIKKPKKSQKYERWVDEYINKLNSDEVCGKKDWRLPDNFELSRLTQLGTKRRSNIFPYIKLWAYLSSSGGEYEGFKKGIDLNNGESYDYREDRPYASIFVSGDIDRTLFSLPSDYLKRYSVKSLNIETKVKEKNSTIIKEDTNSSRTPSPTPDIEKKAKAEKYLTTIGLDNNSSLSSKKENEKITPSPSPTSYSIPKEEEYRGESYYESTGL